MNSAYLKTALASTLAAAVITFGTPGTAPAAALPPLATPTVVAVGVGTLATTGPDTLASSIADAFAGVLRRLVRALAIPRG